MTAYSSTFQDAQGEVMDKLRLDTTADLTKTKAWLNQILLDIAVTSRYFSGSAAGAALAAAAASQALPATLVELEYVTVTYGGQTAYMTPIGFDKLLMLQVTASSGPPTFYTLRKGTVNFWPAAAGGEVLTYYGATLPDAMSANSDVSGLPEPYATKLLVYGACIEAADFKNDMRLYFYYQNAYAAWKASFQAYLNTRMTQAARAFPVYGPDGRPFSSPYLPHDVSSDFYVTGFRG